MSSNYQNAIIGQDRLLNIINNFDLDSFPQSLLLVGETGCGKHLLLKYISAHLNIDVVELDNKITESIISEAYSNAYPCIYVIDIEEMLPKVQNTVLKFLEDPPKGAFIIILSTGSTYILPTLRNRCIEWHFDTYSKKVLSTFVKDSEYKELLLSVANTPGQAISYQQQDLQSTVALINNIVDKIQTASFSNVLRIADKLTFKNEPDKVSVDLFTKILTLRLLDLIEESAENDKYLRMYAEIKRFISKDLPFCIVKGRILDSFLIRLREATLI